MFTCINGSNNNIYLSNKVVTNKCLFVLWYGSILVTEFKTKIQREVKAGTLPYTIYMYVLKALDRKTLK